MRKLLFIATFIVSSSSVLLAQNDFGLWSSVDLKVPVTKKLDVGFGINARFKSNVTEVQKTFVSPSVSYRVMDFLKLGVDYRFANHPEMGFFGNYNTHRITLDADIDFFQYKNKSSDSMSSSKLQLSGRIRYTYENEIGDLDDENLRGQLKLEFDFPKDIGLKASLSSEVFFHFKDQIRYTSKSVTTYNRFSKMRMRVGCEYAINKRSTIEAFYMVEPEFDGPKTDFVLGLGYKYELRRLNKKKKE